MSTHIESNINDIAKIITPETRTIKSYRLL